MRHLVLFSAYMMDLWLVQTNGRYELYDELDLDLNDRALLSETADNAVENKYRLHSVIVQNGEPNRGRYSAFIRPNNKWYEFHNGVVEEATESQAITAQFGQATFLC